MPTALDRLRHPLVDRRALEAVVVALAAGSVVEALVADHVHPRPVVAVLALVWSLPFLLRRRLPFGAPLVVCAAVALLAALGGKSVDHMTTPYLAAVAASVSFGQLGDRRLAVAGLILLAALGSLVAFEMRHSSELFWTLLFFGLAWVFGTVLGSRTRQAGALRRRVEEAERLREQAVLNERTRIARELHDVIAHSISVMVVQAAGVRRLLPEDDDRKRDALRSIEATGRQALNEMRRMLGVMPAEALDEVTRAPQPGLKHLDRLIAQVVEAGLPTTLSVEGDRPDLSAGVDLSAYRIVQEGLANALANPGGSRADVVVRYQPSTVEIEITDDGPGLALFDVNGDSLIGMRERVALYGGKLHVDPRDEGGFVLHAQLPVEVCP